MKNFMEWVKDNVDLTLTSKDEIVRFWNMVGFLEGLNQPMKECVALNLQDLSYHLIKKDTPYEHLTQYVGDYLLECLFPMYRRILCDETINNPTMVIDFNDIIQYLNKYMLQAYGLILIGNQYYVYEDKYHISPCLGCSSIDVDAEFYSLLAEGYVVKLNGFDVNEFYKEIMINKLNFEIKLKKKC